MPRRKSAPGRKQPGANATPSGPTGPAGRARRPRIVAAAVALALLGAGAWYWPSEGEATAAATGPATSRSGGNFLQTPDMPLAEASPAARAERLQVLAAQVELADQTLCSYREGTRYPNSSRPIAEHPDQVHPNRPVEESHPLRKEQGGADDAVMVRTTQSRVYLAAGEAVAFTVGATDAEGKALPLFVTRAVTRGLSFKGAREAPQLALPFADDGRGGDAAASDGTATGVLVPAQTGFAQFDGTIRTEVKYQVGDRAGVVVFDVIYSPDHPATWSGPARDAIEDGSLHFYLKADVRTAGRYIVSGRVDDAKGRPFALATFNDLLHQGSNEIRLSVFGKLVRDQMPALPLTLRDVDGYLLKENTDPDRALMPRLEGTVQVAKAYPLKSFSDAEWQSEERARYLTEFGKDVDLAKKALLEFNPDQASQGFPQSECSRKLGAGRS